MSSQQQKYNKLAGKHVLIIGGTSGLGYAVAEASIESNAHVSISSSSPEKVKSSVEKLRKTYPSSTVSGYVCDLSQPTVEKDLEALFAQVGKLDHIVLTAGDPLASMPVQDFTYEKIIAAGQVRFIAPLLIAKVGPRYLNPGPASSIIFTNGSIAMKPIPEWSIVAAYAAAAHGFTRNLAIDLAPIRVNSVSPGVVRTEMWDYMSKEDREAFYKNAEETRPTKHAAGPEEVAEAYLWLMKDNNVTGFIAESDSGVRLI